jgi:hypothetical protein
MLNSPYAEIAMSKRAPSTRLRTIRDIVAQAEAEAAALFIREKGKREALWRVLVALAAVRSEIDGMAREKARDP